jgi:hypothetical protein
VFTAIGPHEEFDVVDEPIGFPSAYTVTTVPARAVPLSVPETEIAFSAIDTGNVPQRAELVAVAVATVEELELIPQVPF